MQTAYFEAVVNRRHRVLGRELDDFCLYHAQFLTLAENPLWFRQREPTLGDLQEAVLLCSLPPERFLRAEIAPRNFHERITRSVWKWRCLRLDLSAELAAFAAYLADYESLPTMWESSTKGRSLNAPWTLSLACFLEIHTNMTEREIMTSPYGYIRWKAETVAERLGVSVSEIMSEEEIAMAAEQRAALEAAGETFPDGEEDEDEEAEPIGGS